MGGCIDTGHHLNGSFSSLEQVLGKEVKIQHALRDGLYYFTSGDVSESIAFVSQFMLIVPDHHQVIAVLVHDVPGNGPLRNASIVGTVLCKSRPRSNSGTVPTSLVLFSTRC